MNNGKFLGFLGLARRAGKLTYGMTAVLDEINKNKAKLVIFSNDFSQNSEKQFFNSLNSEKADVIKITAPYSMAEISAAIGTKPTGILSVSDENFIKGILKEYQR